MAVEVPLLPAQKKLITSDIKKILLLGGIGTGKTHTLGLQALAWASTHPKSKYMICANTYTQLMNATIPAVISVLEEYNVPYRFIKSTADKRLIILNTEFLLYSLQNYEVIRGIEVGGILADEICFAKREAYDVIMGRLRDKNGPLQFRGFSSPNGFTWTHDEFGNIQVGENKQLIKAKTSDNIFLPHGYYEDLVDQYGGIDNPLARQELLGEFVNLTAGAIYWGFNRDKNVAPLDMDTMKRAMCYVGQDFNVDPMCSINVVEFGGKFWVWRENVLRDSNSEEASDHLLHTMGNQKFKVIPDSTGKARKTSSDRGQTDIEIFRQKGITVAKTKNPLIRDRQNNLNLKMKQGRVIIDPSCMHLIRELETLSARDKEGDVSHVAVALGYVIWKLDPIRKPSRSSYSTGR